jgi:hypothetical protein
MSDHIAYHDLWQPEALNLSAEAEGTKVWLARYQAWRHNPDDRALREALEAALGDFVPRAGLHLDTAGDGSSVLPLVLSTDIEDEAFLAAFELGVERIWNDSPAMKAERVRIDITLRPRRARTLGTEAVPGSPVDLAAHLEEFGPGELVLTTGGPSTHVRGRAIVLGTSQTTPRTLAHEVAHLLGFADRYLRAAEGPIGTASGATLLEIVPFPSDLMSSPGRGRITTWMVRRLIDSYGKTQDEAARPR